MDKTGHDSASTGGADSLSALLSQSRHLLANRLVHAYQEELDFEPIEAKKEEESIKVQVHENDIADEIGLTTIDQRMDCQKNEVTNFESRQGDTKSYFNADYESATPGKRRNLAQITILRKEANESVGPFGTFSTI